MNVLVLGSGGREHALAWRLSQDKSADQVFVWPGNPGMKGGKIRLLSGSFSQETLAMHVRAHAIQLVVPGAEKFLYEGVARWCEELRVSCFGPSPEAAALERSKLFSKKVMIDAGVPTSRFEDLTNFYRQDLDGAWKVLEKFHRPVIKVSGPSLGKGVFVCSSASEAKETLKQIKDHPIAGLEEGIFVEEAVSGEEISLFYACSGEEALFLGAAQDHKRLLDNDEGPNTGGMGAISPVSWATPDFLERARTLVLAPTLRRMQELGTPFRGVLFLGLMVDGDDMSLLEYNVRFGDPETQTFLPLIEGDLTSVLFAFGKGEKAKSNLQLSRKTSVHVVKAASGYPATFGGEIEKDRPITDRFVSDSGATLFYAGVKREGDLLLTSGGRVLGVTALASNKSEAKALVYRELAKVSFPGEQYRRDIGSKG